LLSWWARGIEELKQSGLYSNPSLQRLEITGKQDGSILKSEVKNHEFVPARSSSRKYAIDYD
ncbi:MAG: hypothetical protein WBI11_07930, partial [Schleiferiaceae bacterium]